MRTNTLTEFVVRVLTRAMTLVPRQCELTRSWNLRGDGMHCSDEICKLGNKAGNANVISYIFNKFSSHVHFGRRISKESKPFYLTFQTSNFLIRNSEGETNLRASKNRLGHVEVKGRIEAMTAEVLGSSEHVKCTCVNGLPWHTLYAEGRGTCWTQWRIRMKFPIPPWVECTLYICVTSF